MWLTGPSWLKEGEEPPRPAIEDDGAALPEACRAELKKPSQTTNLVATSAAMTSIGSIVDAERAARTKNSLELPRMS